MSSSAPPLPLPPLPLLIAQLPPPSTGSRLDQTLEIIRQVALKCRLEESRSFYSMRDFEKVLETPLRTVAIAFKQLEADGLLLRLRGSHTKLLGFSAKPTAPIISVVGLLENMFILRQYVWRRTFTRSISDILRKHHFSTDTIFHWEHEDRDHDLLDRVLLHQPDVAVWFHPFRPTRETIATLRDRGIRNLIVSDCEVPGIAANIVINWEPGYRRTLAYWRREHQIQRVIMLEGSPHSVHRLRRFEAIACEYGIECFRFPSKRRIASQLLASEALDETCGIVLLDEWAAVDFSLREPTSFLALCKRHRVLYGREVPSIPFLEPKKHHFEVLRYPINELRQAIRSHLLKWHVGEFQLPPIELEAEIAINSAHDQWM